MKERSENGTRRAFMKGIFAGVLGISAIATHEKEGSGHSSQLEHASEGHSNEVLYRETEEFRRFYESLRN